MVKHIRWALLWPIVFITTGIIARLLSPIACLFVRYELRTDTVKRQNKQVVTMMREYLPTWLSWFATDDNAADEYWHGMYPLSKHFTQAQYDNSWLIRYFMRVCWLQRNSGYTFKRKFFGMAKDSPYAWQYTNEKYGCNIGYKAHKKFDRLMYAGRLFKFNNKG
jgi:hypothetical protein